MMSFDIRMTYRPREIENSAYLKNIGSGYLHWLAMDFFTHFSSMTKPTEEKTIRLIFKC